MNKLKKTLCVLYWVVFLEVVLSSAFFSWGKQPLNFWTAQIGIIYFALSVWVMTVTGRVFSR